jgi:CMP-N-acetylneuraminic acid synthetase
MNGKPMISYVTEAVIKANITDQIFINTDSDEIIDYINQNYPKMKIYQRDKDLANDLASSDQFNFDIINKLNPDTLIMINPVCPLIDSLDIVNALKEYKNSDCDTLISSTSTKMQTFCDGEPVNINVNEELAPSQLNKVVTILNWAITIWDVKSFTERMNEKGYAVLGSKRYLFDIDQLKSVKVSEEKDFLFAESLLKSKL